MNCWEFKKCGYGHGGSKAHQVGMCTVALESRLNTIHGGKNGGRACWVVQDSNCQKKSQQNFAQKFVVCMSCDFYLKVKGEEGANLISSTHLFKFLR